MNGSDRMNFLYLNRENRWKDFLRHGLEVSADGTVKLASLPLLEVELPAEVVDLDAPTAPAGIAVGPLEGRLEKRKHSVMQRIFHREDWLSQWKAGAYIVGYANVGEIRFHWTPDAKERLERLPSFVKPMVQSSIEAYARRQGYTTITLQIMDDSKNDSNGIAWTPEAEKRLENIPDFIRPMARREIERLAKERGATTITAQVMDEAKEKFMKFM